MERSCLYCMCNVKEKSTKGRKSRAERRRKIQSLARASFREIKRFRRRRRGSRATSRAQLVLRWYIQRCNGRYFRNWNNIGAGRSKGLPEVNERASISSSVETRSVFHRASPATSALTNKLRRFGFELSARWGFIVRPEVIPMLIPLCPRQDGPNGGGGSWTVSMFPSPRARLHKMSTSSSPFLPPQ